MLLNVTINSDSENIYSTISQDRWLTDTIEIIITFLEPETVKYKLFYRLKVQNQEFIRIKHVFLAFNKIKHCSTCDGYEITAEKLSIMDNC